MNIEITSSSKWNGQVVEKRKIPQETLKKLIGLRNSRRAFDRQIKQLEGEILSRILQGEEPDYGTHEAEVRETIVGGKRTQKLEVW